MLLSSRYFWVGRGRTYLSRLFLLLLQLLGHTSQPNGATNQTTNQLTCPAPPAFSLYLPPACPPACLQGCLPATVQQFRSTASVRLDDFMENFIEQAETISFGAINVVRWTQWQLPSERELTCGRGKWMGVLFECF